MERAVFDIALYFRFQNGNLTGLTGNYVDDNLTAGQHEFQKEY